MSYKRPPMDRKNIPLESDETDSDAHSGEGLEWQELERLSIPDSVKRKQGEILMASAWTANVRQRLAEIEEVALEEFKKEKKVKLANAVERTENFRWALLEVEDWGLAMKESLLPDGTPMKFSKYFLTNLKAAVEKSEAALALAKIALKATLNVGYLGVVGNFPFELIGAPFSQLARTHADLARDLAALEKRLKMWRDIVDDNDPPSTSGASKGSIYKYGADGDSMVNPADPYFEADNEVQGTLQNEISETINNARTSDGKPVDSRGILERYFNYLNQYRDNYWAEVPRPAPAPKPENKVVKYPAPPAPQREMTRAERREARQKAAEEQKAARYAEQLAHVRMERIRRKERERRERQRREQTELRKELVERIERERNDSERKRKRAIAGAKGERLGFYKTDFPDVPPEKNKRARTEESPLSSPKPPPVPPPTPDKPVTPPLKPSQETKLSQESGPTPPHTPRSDNLSPKKLPKWVDDIVSGQNMII